MRFLAIILTLLSLVSSALADGYTPARLSVSKTFSAAMKSGGWRLVEVLRVEYPGIEDSFVSISKQSKSKLEVHLPDSLVLQEIKTPINSALFRSISIDNDLHTPLMHLELVQAEHKRSCISDSMPGVFFLVCTQLFESEQQASLKPVSYRFNRSKEVPKTNSIQAKKFFDADAFSPPKNSMFKVQKSKVLKEARVEPAVFNDNAHRFRSSVVPAEEIIKNDDIPEFANRKDKAPKLEEARVKVLNSEAAATKSLKLNSKKVHATLQTVKFDKQGKSSYISLPFSDARQFTITRVGDDRYHLLIPNSSLSHSGLKLPFFAPIDNAGGVQYLEIENEQDGLLVKIKVDRGSQLKAINDGTELKLISQI